jgi:uncharacterized protein
LVDEVDGRLVPAGRRPVHRLVPTVRVDLLVLRLSELEASLEIAVLLPEGRLSRLLQLLWRVDDFDCALLEFDRLATGKRCDIDEPLGDLGVAVVVDADLGEDVTGMSVADGAIPEYNFHQCVSPGTLARLLRIACIALELTGPNPFDHTGQAYAPSHPLVLPSTMQRLQAMWTACAILEVDAPKVRRMEYLARPNLGAGDTSMDTARTAAVTGAAGGLGAAFARSLAAQGYDLFLTDRDADALDVLTRDLQREGHIRVAAVAADLTRDADVERIKVLLAEIDDLSLLVNNAGFGTYSLFHEADLARQIEMVRVHIVASMGLCHAVLPGMIARRRGSIINVASAGAFMRFPRDATYIGTKSFLVAFTECLAIELVGTGVSVEALCPAWVHTSFSASGDYAKVGYQSPVPAWLFTSPERVVASALRSIGKGPVTHNYYQGPNRRVAPWEPPWPRRPGTDQEAPTDQGRILITLKRVLSGVSPCRVPLRGSQHGLIEADAAVDLKFTFRSIRRGKVSRGRRSRR